VFSPVAKLRKAIHNSPSQHTTTFSFKHSFLHERKAFAMQCCHHIVHQITQLESGETKLHKLNIYRFNAYYAHPTADSYKPQHQLLKAGT
jgi:hypothetical protein